MSDKIQKIALDSATQTLRLQIKGGSDKTLYGVATPGRLPAELAKLYEDRNALLAGGGLVTFTGTQLQFSQVLELHLNTESDPTMSATPVVVNLGSATLSLTSSGHMIYAVVNRVAGTATITDASTTLPYADTSSTGSLEVFLIAKRVDSPDGVKRVYFRNGSALDEGQTARLGSSGTSSTSNSILETIKNILVDSPYELATPNIIATDGYANFATLTGATYDLITKTIKFTANAQVATSIQMLDSVEFLSRALDVGSIDLFAFWDKGTTLTSLTVPPAFTYDISRDGGTNYQTITMNRVGTTEAFQGALTFTTEAVKQNIAAQATQDANRSLNATTQQQVSQAFTIANTTVLQEVALQIAKVGSPSGNLYVSFVNDSAGSPSTALSDVIAQSNAVSITSLVAGPATVTVTMPSTTLVAGTYHMVISTDTAYKTSFSAGVTEVRLRDKQTGPASPFEKSYNGTIWANSSPSANLTYQINGRVLDLRVRITSAGFPLSPANPAGLDGFAIFYNLQDVGITSASRKTQRFTFNSVTDNSNSFTITSFTPSPDLLSCYYVETGQVYKVPAFVLSGNVATFATNTFNNNNVSATVTLIFDQNSGGAFDNSDLNALLLAGNFLGSTNGAIDRSLAGRGIFLRRPDGTLREITIDNSDNIVVYSI